MTKDIGKCMDEYNIYQEMKHQIEAPVRKLMANKVLERL